MAEVNAVKRSYSGHATAIARLQTRDTGDKFVLRIVQIEANLLETRGREYNAGAAGYEVCARDWLSRCDTTAIRRGQNPVADAAAANRR